MFPFSLADMAGPWMLWIVGIAAGIGLVSRIVPAIRRPGCRSSMDFVVFEQIVQRNVTSP
jgi:hypothetical protein